VPFCDWCVNVDIHMKPSSSWTWSTAEHDAGTHESAAATSSMINSLSESEVSSKANSGGHSKFKCAAQTALQSNRWSWSTTGTLDISPIEANPFRSKPFLPSSLPRSEQNDTSTSDSKPPKDDFHLPDPPHSLLSLATYALRACHCCIPVSTHLTGLHWSGILRPESRAPFCPQHLLVTVPAYYILPVDGTFPSIRLWNVRESEDHVLLCSVY
jgi:hypothetical protein